jgi:O-antigen/teichoic acid export membrane protein
MTRRALVEWFGHARPLAARMLAAHVCSLLASVQMVIAVVGLTKGAQDAGAVRAAQTLLGPIGMVLAATSLHVRPQMARQLRAGDDPFAGAVRVSLFNLAVVLIWTAGAWITPGRYGVRVFGESWESAHALIPAMATVVTVMALASGAVNAILATQRLRSLVWANICMAIACPAVTLAISLMWSTRATVLLYGLATASGAAMLWVALTRTRSR